MAKTLKKFAVAIYSPDSGRLYLKFKLSTSHANLLINHIIETYQDADVDTQLLVREKINKCNEDVSKLEGLLISYEMIVAVEEVPKQIPR